MKKESDEDRTFRLLKRKTFEDALDVSYEHGRESKELVNKIKSLGWEYEEFLDEAYRRFDESNKTGEEISPKLTLQALRSTRKRKEKS